MRLRKVWIIVIMVLLEAWWCDACWKHERIALSQIQHSFNFPKSSLASWGVDHDCCNWVGVECNPTTKRVTAIDVSYANWLGYYGDIYLNATLFLPFQDLKALYLGENGIVGCFVNEGFERLSPLTNLEVLDLTGNGFNNSILPSLAALVSLKSLDLSLNGLSGFIDIQVVNDLTSLVELDMESNAIEGFKSFQGREESLRLSKLQVLDLSYNDFSNNILSSLKLPPSLKSLDLSGNQLNDSINMKELDGLNNLEGLDLSENEINKFVFSEGVALKNLERLDLSFNRFDNAIVSSLRWLSSLKYLDLSHNYLNGTVNIKGMMLNNLEELDLSGNNFGNNIPSSLRGLTSLKNLHLGNCQLKGNIELDGLNNLEGLDLNWNEINEFLFSKDLPNLTSLKWLNLSDNNLTHNFLQTIGRMPSLETLRMRNCGLGGTIPKAEGLCELNRLRELDMSFNYLSHNLPSCLENLTSLQFLDLSNNHFVEDIFTSPLRSLTNLESLHLSNNLLQIPFSLHPFFNHSKLKSFFADINETYEETESHHLSPNFQLEEISLSGKGYGGSFPVFLYHQFNLMSVHFSNFKLRGGFPNWLLENNTKLYSLFLSNCSLSGPFVLQTRPHTNLSSLDVSKNFFEGNIPMEIGTKFPNLAYLNMSRNGFNGNIPSSMGKLILLHSLDLSNNRLSNGIPEHLTTDCFLLDTLILSNNNLRGPIFSKHVNLKGLSDLQLDHNHFTGSVPESLSNCSWLSTLDLSHNHISGRIPEWLGNMSFLEILSLSGNNISGDLPSSFHASKLIEIHLSKNKLKGPLTKAFDKAYELVILDLSHNYFTGRIPEWFSRFQQLNFLLLSHNNLEGEIPTQLCNLGQLSLIDLSHNKLSGQVLPCLKPSGEWYRQAAALNPSITASAPFPVLYPNSAKEPLEITTKDVSHFYQGNILHYISGIDLSCNKLTGEIPHEIGYLGMIEVLNLSSNNLTGPIPVTFSNLRQIESLDLSYNNLDGKIPPQLIELSFLVVFSVAHNNLSGRLPDMVAQFATFSRSSYEDNPFLCGPPLPKKCFETMSPTPMPGGSTNDKQHDGSIDMGVFYVSFVVSYIMVLLGIAAVLYINPYWRRVWFYFIELSIDNCYYFIVDNLPMLSKLWCL